MVYVPAPPLFEYHSGLYLAGGNTRKKVVAIARIENLVMCSAFFAAWKYGLAEHSFGYAQFDAHEGGFIVTFPTSLMEDGTSVGLTRLLSL